MGSAFYRDPLNLRELKFGDHLLDNETGEQFRFLYGKEGNGYYEIIIRHIGLKGGAEGTQRLTGHENELSYRFRKVG